MKHAEPIGTLTPREQNRLAAILSRLSSPFEAERAAAGLLASAFVRARGLSWADLPSLLKPAGPTLPPPETDRRRGARTSWQGYCRRRAASIGQALSRLA